MRWPLRYQILLPFAGVMLAVVLGVSLLDAVLAARRTSRQIERQLNDVAQTLVDATFPLTDAVLKQTRGLSGAEFVVLDEGGRLKASSLHRVDTADMARAPAGQAPFRLGNPIDVDARQYLHAAVPLEARADESEKRVLHILYPEDVLQQARWQAAYPPLLVGSVLLLVVVVLAVAIAGRLTRPILELRRQLGRLVQGDFQPLPVPQRNDELRDLIFSVNSLGDQLDEFRRAIKRSERLALLGQLSGGLAHQLRNAVTGARIATQLHQRHCHQDPESLAVALRQLAMTESHLQRFLSAGQPAAPRRADCDLDDVIAEVASLVAPSCQHHSVDLQLPTAGACCGKLWADPVQLGQLLMNLLINAIEAAGPGGWVRIELVRLDGAITLRVLDSGPGPKPELLAHLFEPFVTGKPEGIGLGLTVARQIAVAHGGTLRYTGASVCSFEVALPAGAEQSSTGAERAAAASSACTAGMEQRLT